MTKVNLLPKFGTLPFILRDIRKLRPSHLETWGLSRYVMDRIEEVNTLTRERNIHVGVKFTTFKPNEYQSNFTTVIPNSAQLPIAVKSLYYYDPKNPEKEIHRPAKKVALQAIAEHFLKMVLPEEELQRQFSQNPGKTFIDHMYAYHNKTGTPMPRTFVHMTHGFDDDFKTATRCTAVVRSLLLPEPAPVTLNGRKSVTYGLSLQSACNVLFDLLLKLDIILKESELEHKSG